jgi:hypothetical protein
MFSVKIEYQPNQIINGLIFLRETQIHTTPNGKKFRKAIFECSCGNEFETWITSVKAGLTSSCGCLIKRNNIQIRTTHGLYKHPLYIVWKNMRQRCYNKKYDRYSDWGGRGIKICDEWLNDFKVFYDWATANGYSAGLTIDRIDNDGNYEPNNCRWATNAEQQLNKRKKAI